MGAVFSFLSLVIPTETPPKGEWRWDSVEIAFSVASTLFRVHPFLPLSQLPTLFSSFSLTIIVQMLFGKVCLREDSPF